MKPKFYIGTFYSKQQSGSFDWLQFYSHYFKCVEVNSTYYAYISPKVVEGWVRKVSDTDEFIFDVKLHQDFTHKRNYNEQNVKAVRCNLDLLSNAERLGGLLIQFPYSFSFNNSAIHYIRKLNDTFPNYNTFVEVRHSSWKNKNAFDFFKDANLTFCTIDQPQIGQAIPFEPIVTNDKAYIRFHGRNEEAWKNSINNFGKNQSYVERSERYKYLYTPGELIEIEQKIKLIQKKVKEVHVIMNNHPQGDAVANAFELVHFLEVKDRVEMPKTVLKAYPRLEEIAKGPMSLDNY
jgi:uncharacterized protein YecE (DUF72 family)